MTASNWVTPWNGLAGNVTEKTKVYYVPFVSSMVHECPGSMNRRIVVEMYRPTHTATRVGLCKKCDTLYVGAEKPDVAV